MGWENGLLPQDIKYRDKRRQEWKHAKVRPEASGGTKRGFEVAFAKRLTPACVVRPKAGPTGSRRQKKVVS